MEDTNPNITTIGIDFEYKINTVKDGVFVGTVWRNGKLVGSPSSEYNYEGIHAWLRLVMGDYPDSYLEVA